MGCRRCLRGSQRPCGAGLGSLSSAWVPHSPVCGLHSAHLRGTLSGAHLGSSVPYLLFVVLGTCAH
eukprot:6217409-Alexandrium_andersonii.AAC.1